MALSFKHQAFLCLIFLTFSVFGSKETEFKKKILISQAALNLCKKFEKAEGFLAGTLVKTVDGYTSIETLAVGDSVISFDFDGKSCQSRIVQIYKKTIKGFVALQIGEKTVCAGPDQKFFLPEKGDWIKAKNVALSNQFLIKSDQASSALEIKLCDQTVDVYSISLDEHHNFCITENDILVHNVAPAVGVGIVLAIDGGKIVITAVTFSIGVIGFWFGCRRETRRTYYVEGMPCVEVRQENLISRIARKAENIGCYAVPKNPSREQLFSSREKAVLKESENQKEDRKSVVSAPEQCNQRQANSELFIKTEPITTENLVVPIDPAVKKRLDEKNAFFKKAREISKNKTFDIAKNRWSYCSPGIVPEPAMLPKKFFDKACEISKNKKFHGLNHSPSYRPRRSNQKLVRQPEFCPPSFIRKARNINKEKIVDGGSSQNHGRCRTGGGGTGPNKNDDDDPDKKKRNTERFENMYEWFDKHSMGQKYRNKFEKVSHGRNGEWRAKETFKPHPDVIIEKGDEIYLDRGPSHRGDHFEFFNKGCRVSKGSLNPDLTENAPKSIVAIKNNRTNTR